MKSERKPRAGHFNWSWVIAPASLVTVTAMVTTMVKDLTGFEGRILLKDLAVTYWPVLAILGTVALIWLIWYFDVLSRMDRWDDDRMKAQFHARMRALEARLRAEDEELRRQRRQRDEERRQHREAKRRRAARRRARQRI